MEREAARTSKASFHAEARDGNRPDRLATDDLLVQRGVQHLHHEGYPPGAAERPALLDPQVDAIKGRIPRRIAGPLRGDRSQRRELGSPGVEREARARAPTPGDVEGNGGVEHVRPVEGAGKGVLVKPALRSRERVRD